MASTSGFGSEAQYNNEFFDSQTEAAWAVFFESANMPYVREPETFQFKFPNHPLVDDKIYTPDYYLPDTDLYVEVKNGANIETDKLILLAACTGKTALLVNGKPHQAGLYFYSPHPWVSFKEKIANRQNNPYLADAWTPRVDWLLGKCTNGTLRNAMTENLKHALNGWSTAVDPEVRDASKARKRVLRDNTKVFNV